MEKMILAEKLENEILTLFENRDDYTWSDLQGIVAVIVRKAIEA